jgi:LemA protein
MFMTGTVVFWIFVSILVLVLFYFIAAYNLLIGLRNQVKNSWSQIEVQLKRRHDLIPNLVETAKGYMQHERGTFDAVSKARSDASAAKSIPQMAQAEAKLSDAISRFMAVVENYPELKANQNFLAVQEELASTENKIAFSRQAYNDAVLFLNNKIEMFPSNLVAGMFMFRKEMSFEIVEASERTVPKVNFG